MISKRPDRIGSNHPPAWIQILMINSHHILGKTAMAVLFLCCFSIGFSFGKDNLQWKRESTSVALLQGEKQVWQFNYAAKGSLKPFFHPVALPGGSSLTWLSPPDHVWHLALWFAWKYINKVNYWEENKEGICEGATEWTNVRIETRSDHSARIRLDLRYRPQKAEKPVLTEKRTISISSPAADGSYSMDWAMVFTAGTENLSLDRTPSTPTSISGYAGLSVRLAKELGEIQIAATADKGKMVGNRYGYAATATDFNGRMDQGEAGMAMLDHPGNPRFPNRWYVIVDPSRPFWYMNAAWLQEEPYDLPAGKSMTFRYRILVHPHRWDANRLEQEHHRYVKESGR